MREALNSKTLKERFPLIYEDFFAKSQIAVSSPHYFTWAGEYIGYFEGIMTLQKMPFRLYVGLEETSQGISFSQGQSFSLQNNAFQKDSLEHLTQVRLSEFLASYLKTKKGIRISLLSEISFEGSGSTGALAAAMALSLLLFEKKIKKAELEAWKNKKGKGLFEDKSFKKVFDLAFEIYSVLRNERASKGPIFACLKETFLPVYFLNENQNGSLDEIFSIKENTSFPFSFYLLQIGEPKSSQGFAIEHLKEEMMETAAFFKTDDSWEKGLGLMRFLSSKVLLCLGRAFAGKNNLRDLFQAVDQHQILFLLAGFLGKNTEAFSSTCHYLSHLNDELGCGVKSVSTTKKDTLLLALPHHHSEEVVEKAILKIKKDLKKEFLVAYSSSDGLEKEGLKIEQDIRQGGFSEFIPKEAVLIEEIKSNKERRKFILAKKEFEKKKKEIDLVLAEKKIFLLGTALTSKQIHSQKQTIELLETLLKSPHWQVKNTDLSQSAYSKDRYLLQSKITLPLTKALKKKDLGLAVSGSISNFTVSLKPEAGFTFWLMR